MVSFTDQGRATKKLGSLPTIIPKMSAFHMKWSLFLLLNRQAQAECMPDCGEKYRLIRIKHSVLEKMIVVTDFRNQSFWQELVRQQRRQGRPIRSILDNVLTLFSIT